MRLCAHVHVYVDMCVHVQRVCVGGGDGGGVVGAE